MVHRRNKDKKPTIDKWLFTLFLVGLALFVIVSVARWIKASGA